MKVIVRLILIAGLAIAVAGCAKRVLVQPVLDMSRYRRIAVLPFESDSALTTIGNQLADEVVVNIIKNAPQVDIVERSRMDALLREQQLAREGMLSAESAIAVGRLLGVGAILTGSVSVAIGDIQPSAAFEPQRVASGVVTARLIDVETGRILWGGRQESDYTTFTTFGPGGRTLGVRTDQEMAQEVIKDLGRQLAEIFYAHIELQY